MEQTLVLKAIADDSRMKILTLLLQRNYCVRALSRNLEISEAAISQHLKVLREAGLIDGEKNGYFMHYNVNVSVLHELAQEIEALSLIKREPCSPEQGGCQPSERGNCHIGKAEHCNNKGNKFGHVHKQGELHLNCGSHRKSEG